MLSNTIRTLLFFAVIGLFSSCLKNEICSPLNIHLEGGLYTTEEIEGTLHLIPAKMDIDSIYGITMENNNLLINASDVELISLPLNNATDQSSFVLSIGGIKDTIQITYDKHILFNSVKCGISYTYTIKSIDNFTTHYLQNIILTNPEIDVISTENIQLVF